MLSHLKDASAAADMRKVLRQGQEKAAAAAGGRPRRLFESGGGKETAVLSACNVYEKTENAKLFNAVLCKNCNCITRNFFAENFKPRTQEIY